MRQEFPKGGIQVPIRFLRGGRIVIQLSISSVLRETQGNDQKRPLRYATHKKRPKGDAGCARNFLREVSRFLSVS